MFRFDHCLLWEMAPNGKRQNIQIAHYSESPTSKHVVADIRWSHNRAMKISGQGGAMKSPAAWDKAQGRRGLHRRSTDQWPLLSSHVLGLKCNHRGLMTILFNDCIVVQISLKCPTQTFVEYLLSSESQFCLVLFFFGVLWLSEGKWYPAWA